MKKIIALKAKDRCGKDTISDILKDILTEKGLKVKVIPFALGLKEFISELLGISIEVLDKLKNDNVELMINNKPILTRDFIIKTSMAIKNNFGLAPIMKPIKDVIVKDNIDILITPDIRFKHEYDLLRDTNNLLIIEVISNMKQCGNNNKIYELDTIPSDVCIMNDYNTDINKQYLKLYSQCKRILENIVN